MRVLVEIKHSLFKTAVLTSAVVLISTLKVSHSLASIACSRFLHSHNVTLDFKAEVLEKSVKTVEISQNTVDRIYQIHERSGLSHVPLPKKIKLWPGTSAGVSHYPSSMVSILMYYSTEASEMAESGIQDRIAEEVSHETGHIVYSEILHFYRVPKWYGFNSHIEEMFSDFLEELISYEKTGVLRDKPSEGSQFEGRTFTPLHTPPFDLSKSTRSEDLLKYGTIDPHIYTNDARLGLGKFMRELFEKGASSEKIYHSVVSIFMRFVERMSVETKDSTSAKTSMKRIVELNAQFLEILEAEKNSP